MEVLLLRLHYSFLQLPLLGKEIEEYYRERPLEVWTRLVDIGGPILGWWISRKFDNLTASFRTKEENQERLNLRAADLKDSIVQGRSVTFIKSGDLYMYSILRL